MDNINLIKLKKFIAEYWSYDETQITEDKSLDDFGMYGDDKLDFLNTFSKRFEINMSNINYQKFVEPEPTMLTHLDTIFRLIFRRKLTAKFDVQPITVAMLLNVMEIKKWTVGDNPT